MNRQIYRRLWKLIVDIWQKHNVMNCCNCYKSPRGYLMEKLVPGNISIILQIKREYKSDIIVTMSSTEGTRGNFQKGGYTFIPTVITWTSEWSEWRSPYFVKPKTKSNRVHFINDFRNINKQLKQKPYPILKKKEMILK